MHHIIMWKFNMHEIIHSQIRVNTRKSSVTIVFIYNLIIVFISVDVLILPKKWNVNTTIRENNKQNVQKTILEDCCLLTQVHMS